MDLSRGPKELYDGDAVGRMTAPGAMIDEECCEAILGDMSPSEFRVLLKTAGLHQRLLSRLAGVSYTAVNRWCSETAIDRVPAPRHIVALVVAYSLLSPRARDTLSKRILTLHAEEPK